MKNWIVVFLLFCFNTLHSQITLNFEDVDIIASKYPDTLHGIDVSFHQGKIDWEKIDSIYTFAIIKVSEGVSRLDPKFDYNWENCQLMKGGYHFFRPKYSGVKQADLFLSNLPVNESDIKPVIDVEWTSFWLKKKKRKIAVKNLKEMIEQIESYNIEPIIYTNGHFWNTFISPSYNTNHTIWIADYRKVETPKRAANLPWSIWQYSCKGKVSGIKTKVDKNICIDLDSILNK